MHYLKQSTLVTLKIGPFVDSTDGFTPETLLAITQPDVRLSKNGAAFAQKNDVNAAVHDENGWYAVQINATDTNTLGRLTVAIYEVGALPVWMDYMVEPANVYESMFGADNLQVDLIQWLGVAPLALNAQRVQTHVGAMTNAVIAAATFAAGAIDAAAIANGAIDAATFAAGAINAAAIANAAIDAATFAANAIDNNALAANAVAEIADGVWDEDIVAAHGGASTAGLLLRVLGAAISTRANNPTLNALLGIADAAGRDLPEQIWLEPARTLTALGFVLQAADIGNDAIGAAELAASAVAEIADGVWDELRAGHVGAGSFGQGVASVQGNVTGSVASVVGNLGGDIVGDIQGDVLGNIVGNLQGNILGTVASVVGNLGGNVVGSVASMLAAGRNQMADSILSRPISNVDGAVFRSLYGAVAKNVNRVAQAAGILTIYQTDDATPVGTQAITEDVLANPIVEFDTV